MVCHCPISNQRDSSSMDIIKRFVSKMAVGQSSGLTKNMIPKPPQSFRDLGKLCLIFTELELFLWLQRKFPPGNMIEQQTAHALRDTTIAYISDGLNNVSREVPLVKLDIFYPLNLVFFSHSYLSFI